jgi:uncharacterized RDD family membrane protein YckC
MPMPKTLLYDPTHAERMKELAGVKLASFPARAAALLIDLLLASALFVALMMVPIALIRFIPALRAWDAQRNIHIEMNFLHNWYSLAYTVLFFGLSLYWGRGRTVGKRLMKIRVVSLRHHRLSLWHCIERALGYGASALELGFGFFQYFIHPNRQTVHDRIAETIVIADKRGDSAAGGGAA